MRIQHNIMAMNAYRNYNTNANALSKNLEKLSSGYRINRAGDDAAGLAISEKMRAQITGLDAAQKNVQDGISLVKTAEGAMQEVQDMLNRMVYLATQSANGTYDNDVDRANLQKEVDALSAEIDRIADSANFNGIKLLDGSLDSSVPVNFADAGLVAELDGTKGAASEVPGVFTLDLNQAKWTNAPADDGTATTSKVTVTFAGQEFEVDATGEGVDITGAEVATAIKDFVDAGADDTWTFDDGNVIIDGIEYTVEDDTKGKLTFTQVEAKDFDTQALSFSVTAENVKENDNGDENNGNQGWNAAVTVTKQPQSAGGKLYAQAKVDLSALTITDGSVLKIGDTEYTFAVGADSKVTGKNVIDLKDMKADEITGDKYNEVANRVSEAAEGNSAVYVEVSTQSGVLNLTEKTGGLDYSKYDFTGDDSAGVVDNNATWKDADGNSFVQFGTPGKAEGNALTLQIGDTSDPYNQLKVSIQDIHVDALGIGDIDISTQEGAAAAVDKIKTAINSVSSTRGDLGAIQNRLEHTANNLSVMEENIQNAESAIRDTDIADEMTAYTKNNILLQSAQAMLAQANQVPQGVLQLLG